MIEFDDVGMLDITLEEDAAGKGRVMIKMTDKGELNLSSHQARILATELIMVANRVEVRENLKRNENMVRNNSASDQPRGFFQQAFAK
ncbi:MAG: hypothetical protein ABL892_09720 [Thiobacillaceae bacterium]